jgi:hypothetical protein
LVNGRTTALWAIHHLLIFEQVVIDTLLIFEERSKGCKAMNALEEIRGRMSR